MPTSCVNQRLGKTLFQKRIFKVFLDHKNIFFYETILEIKYKEVKQSIRYITNIFSLLNFQVQNMRSDLTYRFSIVNFSKPDSLYNYGMKPVLYSQIEAERHFVGWSRVGSNIRYVLLNRCILQIPRTMDTRRLNP